MRDILTNEQTTCNILVYGPPGSGKSFAVAGLAPARVLLLQTEPGYVSALKDPTFAAEVKAGRSRIVGIDSWEDLDGIRMNFPAWLTKTKLGLEWNWIVLDSITWATEYCKEYTLAKYPPKNPFKVPEMGNWLMITEMTKQLIQALVRYPANVYLTAQATLKEIGEPGSTTTMWTPGLYGQYATKVAHDVDNVFFARRDKEKFTLECHETSSHMGKTRGIEPGKAIPFDLGQLGEMWREVAAEVS